MKTLLRELGAALIMLSAFMVCHAQQAPQFVGLPEYGVTLGGDANNPTIINTSGRSQRGAVKEARSSICWRLTIGCWRVGRRRAV